MSYENRKNSISLFHIESFSNPKFKALLHLKKNRERRKQGELWIEGDRLVKRYLNGYKKHPHFTCLCITEKAKKKLLSEIESNVFFQESIASLKSILVISDEMMKKLTMRDSSVSMIAMGKYDHDDLEALIPQNDQPALYLIIDACEKPGNLGAMLRIADGAGVRGVILCEDIDLTHPSVLQNSMGALFSLSIAKTNLPNLKKWLKQHSIHVYTTTPSAEESYCDVEYKRLSAVVMGREDCGVSSFWMDELDLNKTLISIPMSGIADSLNVASAASVICYEYLRQTKKRG